MSLGFKQAILLSVFFSSTAALARDYEDNGDVSSMKGQLVEVGERNRYHYDFPRLNLSLNPFGIVTGTYSFSGSYAVTDNIAPRVDVSYTEANADQKSGYELGAGAQIFFKKMYNGIYLEPGVVRMHKDVESAYADDWRFDVFGPQVLVGYSWFWDSGFNVQLAGGVGRNLMKSDGDDYEDTSDNTASINVAGRTFGNAYLRVGYAF